MATDAQTLLTEAQCYECNGANDYSLLLMKLALLRQILLASNPVADTTPQALLADASCFSCYASTPYMLQLMELALLAQIVDAGGGGGGGSLVTLGVVNPEGVVTDNPGALYWNKAGKVLWVKETGVGSVGWWQIV
jgi:hypothetical protein